MHSKMHHWQLGGVGAWINRLSHHYPENIVLFFHYRVYFPNYEYINEHAFSPDCSTGSFLYMYGFKYVQFDTKPSQIQKQYNRCYRKHLLPVGVR